MQLKKPTRYHRIDRDPPIKHLEDDTGHLWAVSYADFLMVLLSFFILFFSVANSEKDAIVNIITKAKEKGLDSGGISGGAGTPLPAHTPQEIAQSIQSQMSNLNVELNDKLKSATFILAEEIYKPGHIMPNLDGQKTLKELINLLKPYEKDIDVVFVGHTDSVPVKKGKLMGIQNNFDLSALRASAAVSFAINEGLPKGQLFTHGSADNTRQSKSLSIIAKPRGSGSL